MIHKLFFAAKRYRWIIFFIILSYILYLVFYKPATIIVSSSTNTGVKTIESHAQERNISLRYSGITKADKSIMLRSEVAAKVIRVVSKDGALLEKGDVILELDPQNKIKIYEEALSNLETATIQLESARKIYKGGLGSKGNYLDALTKLKTAEADLEEAELEVSKTKIIAPFKGYIETIKVEAGDYVAIGEELAAFSALDKLIVTIYVPQAEIFHFKIGDPAVVAYEINGYISFIGKIADSVTRTFPLEITIENKNLRIGEDVRVEISKLSPKLLHHLPKSAIVLDIAGQICVKTIKNNQVKTKVIEIVDEDDDGFWISGLEALETVIILGGAYINDGMEIKI